jgi:superfamily II DNA or RNA helicase
VTVTAAPATAREAPEPGQLVRVRGRHWVVADVSASAFPAAEGVAGGPERLVTLSSVEDDRYDEQLQVLWDLEPGAQVLERATMPGFDPDRLDDPARLAAFLDAVRWGAVTSADSAALQAPFRSGIAIEDYQLDPVVRALRMPRVNLLIADDVGLGKTIEAGLVVQELLLRHRARSVLVVCPASLCVKWRDEMAEKFGLEFRIIDTELLRHLRRTRGLRANPWTHFPRLITSIDWLKRDRPMRLLREVLPSTATYPRTFDLLIVDEVHNVAPAARGRYATDSQRTRAIRAIAPHFEHRLFLSATPHNGYRESWTALLELLDPQRFARGVDPDPTQLRRIMVRRLKSELPPHEDGTPRFPRRVVEAIEVDYPPEEREAHRLLEEYAELRRRSAHDEAGRMAAEFSLKLLKKRIFSSPAAFARTLEVHRKTAFGTGRLTEGRTTIRVLAAAIDRTEDDVADEEEHEEAVRSALVASSTYLRRLGPEEASLLDQLRSWASQASGRPDAKAKALLSWLDDIVRPAGEDGVRRFGDERVIVFTEYRDTQRYLVDLLEAHGLGDERLALLHGGMDEAQRERTKAVFQADPALDPVRILVATDAASEGIDLQAHCHRLVHYEIPWNPNRLEQRNGRIDRHGQRAPEVLVSHFVGSRFTQASPGSLEDDLEFLNLVAQKVNTIRDDLGSAGPVIAAQVEERMLGRRRRLDEEEIDRAVPKGRLARVERDLREQIDRLRQRLANSVVELHLAPDNVERVVRTALALAHQPDLIDATLERSGKTPPQQAVFRLPRLTGSWARCAEGLAHPVTGEIRPVTFDHQVASGSDDVVLAHLGHRLVAQAVWLLRAEVWAGADARLARVTARVIPDGAANEVAVIAHGRLVVTGAAGHRLHEEVIAAGGFLRSGRFARISTLGQLQAILDAPTVGLPPKALSHQLARDWPTIADALVVALTRRQQDRTESLEGLLARRAEEDAAAVAAVLGELERSIRAELAAAASTLQLQLPVFAADERAQAEHDLDALRRRLEEIPAETEAEVALVRRRYAEPTPRLFPAAVEVCVPEHMVVR